MSSHHHPFRTVVEHECGYVGTCTTCRTINVAFNNSLFCYSEADFAIFRTMIAERDGLEYLSTSHGKEWMLRTPMQNYFILFSDEELEDLNTMLTEAALLMEANRLLEA